jgi:hypothetical protein
LAEVRNSRQLRAPLKDKFGDFGTLGRLGRAIIKYNRWSKLICFARLEKEEKNNCMMNENNSKSHRTVIDPSIPEHDVCVEWSIRVWGRDTEILNIDRARALYPLALDPLFVQQTSSGFPVVVQTLIIDPLLGRFTHEFQRRFKELMGETKEDVEGRRVHERQTESMPGTINQFGIPSDFFDESFRSQPSDDEIAAPGKQAKGQAAERRKAA